MKAVVVVRDGPRPRAVVVETPAPVPGPGESLVQLIAAPIEPMDRLILLGFYPLGTRGSIDGNLILGAQGLGRVVTSDRPELVDARVLLPVRSGTWRSQLAVPTASLIRVPDDVSDEAAAPLRIGATSASAMLEWLQPGDAFVQSPGAGAVGLYAAQLAKRRGLRAICLVRTPERRALLMRLGAHAVLPDDSDAPRSVARLGLQPRLALDGTGGVTTKRLAACLADGGTVVRYGAISGAHAELDVAASVFRDISIRGFWLRSDERARKPEDVAARIEGLLRSKLEIPIAARMPLVEVSKALELSRTAHGRVLLTP